jgi:hypothetical protein
MSISQSWIQIGVLVDGYQSVFYGTLRQLIVCVKKGNPIACGGRNSASHCRRTASAERQTNIAHSMIFMSNRTHNSLSVVSRTVINHYDLMNRIRLLFAALNGPRNGPTHVVCWDYDGNGGFGVQHLSSCLGCLSQLYENPRPYRWKKIQRNLPVDSLANQVTTLMHVGARLADIMRNDNAYQRESWTAESTTSDRGKTVTSPNGSANHERTPAEEHDP